MQDKDSDVALENINLEVNLNAFRLKEEWILEKLEGDYYAIKKINKSI